MTTDDFDDDDDGDDDADDDDDDADDHDLVFWFCFMISQYFMECTPSFPRVRQSFVFHAREN